MALAGWLAAALASGPGARAQELLPPPALELHVRAARVHRGQELRLEAELTPPRRAVYRWAVDAGELLVEEGALVYWQAPLDRSEARVSLKVELVGSRHAPLVVERVIPVETASTEGMVRIPGGEFTMGDDWTDVNAPDYIQTSQNMADKPAHPVRVSSFYIDRRRVTHGQYVRFLEDALENGLLEVTPFAVFGLQRGGGKVPFLRFSYDDVPESFEFEVPRLFHAIRFENDRFTVAPEHEHLAVVDVTWAGADAYARALGKSLPTEAHWEYAARGQDGRRFPWGNELPTPRHANLNYLHGRKQFPVGTFSPEGDSPFGVQEMVGGVFEWVHDWYNDRYYADLYSTDPLVDPRGPHWGRDHVIRGLSSTYSIRGARIEPLPVSFRYAWILEIPIGDGFANAETGFRCAIAVDRVDAGPSDHGDAGPSDHGNAGEAAVRRASTPAESARAETLERKTSTRDGSPVSPRSPER